MYPARRLEPVPHQHDYVNPSQAQSRPTTIGTDTLSCNHHCMPLGLVQLSHSTDTLASPCSTPPPINAPGAHPPRAQLQLYHCNCCAPMHPSSPISSTTSLCYHSVPWPHYISLSSTAASCIHYFNTIAVASSRWVFLAFAWATGKHNPHMNVSPGIKCFSPTHDGPLGHHT